MTQKLTPAEAIAACERQAIHITGILPRRRNLPKTHMGELADELHALRQQRLALTKVVDAIKREEQRITDHIIDTVDADREGGVVGTGYKALIVRDTAYNVADWDVFYEHVLSTGHFHYLNRALNRASVKEVFEAGRSVPGVEPVGVKKISLTKV